MVIKTGLIACASALLLACGTTAKDDFKAGDVSGAFKDPKGGKIKFPFPKPDGGTLARPDLKKKGTMIRLSNCDERQPAVDEIRSISNEWLAGGTKPSSHGFSNLVWAWGQFIDHDIVATVDGDDSLHKADEIILNDSDGVKAVMRLHRLVSEGTDKCPRPVVVNTPIIDAGVVYGNDRKFLKKTLRQPRSCMLRTSDGDMLPISTAPNHAGKHVFIAGDNRVDEHAVLTMMHTVWMREHNRLCEHMNYDPEFKHMTNNQKFRRARNVVIAKMQEITMHEWLPLLGISPKNVKKALPLHHSPDISVEFSTAAYRFGHDMVPDHLGPVRTVDLFNGNAFYGIEKDGRSDSAAASRLDDIALFTSQSLANEIDGKFSDTLRNTLFGAFGEDLGSRNIYRGGDMHIADYKRIAEVFGVEVDEDIYRDTPMPFIALLRENRNPGKFKPVFGPTIRAVVTEQFHRIFYSEDGDWWEDRMDDVAGFEDEIYDTTIASVINDNTDAFVQDDAFLFSKGGFTIPKKGGGGGGKGGPGGKPKIPKHLPSFPSGFPKIR